MVAIYIDLIRYFIKKKLESAHKRGLKLSSKKKGEILSICILASLYSLNALMV